MRLYAGSAGALIEHVGFVMMTFPMDDGAAVVTGRLNNGRMEGGTVCFKPAAES